VSNVLLLTSAREAAGDIVPSLGLLPHTVRVAPAVADQIAIARPAPDAVLLDARRDLAHARRLLRALQAAPAPVPVIVVVSEGGWAATSADWGADDFLLHTAGPAEVEARLRLVIGRLAQPGGEVPNEIRSGELVVNEATYSAKINGRVLDLTFKEFELLKFLAQHPGRVFTRAQLLQEVWGYDYFGGTRTVDVHVRRLRAKLGADNEELIGTVRNVGYRFVPGKSSQRAAESAGAAGNTDAAELSGGRPGPRPADPARRGTDEAGRPDPAGVITAGPGSRPPGGASGLHGASAGLAQGGPAGRPSFRGTPRTDNPAAASAD
jgi:DNA-binding response OmpR family regulator